MRSPGYDCWGSQRTQACDNSYPNRESEEVVHELFIRDYANDFKTL
jgi:hypothetical protein